MVRKIPRVASALLWLTLMHLTGCRGALLTARYTRVPVLLDGPPCIGCQRGQAPPVGPTAVEVYAKRASLLRYPLDSRETDPPEANRSPRSGVHVPAPTLFCVAPPPACGR